MDDQKLFGQIRNLCMACGMSIDAIAKDCNINQDLVAKMFLETMQTILDKMQEGHN